MTILECCRNDLLCCDYLAFTRIMNRSDIPGVPLVSPSGIHAAWVSIEKFPHRGWFDIVFSGIQEFVFLRLGDIAIFVLSDGSQLRYPFLRHVCGSVIRQNSINVRDSDLARMVAGGIDRIVFCRITSRDQRSFRFERDGGMVFRWMAMRIYDESKNLGW